MNNLLVRSTPTLQVEPAWPVRLFGGLVGRTWERPQYAVRVPDLDLRRIGHLVPSPPDGRHSREEFRIIKRAILSRVHDGDDADGRDRRIILVTSSGPGEGKTFNALNLALSLTLDRECAVTLVDGDLTGRGLSNRFDLGGARGLLEVLEGDSDLGSAVQSTNVSNLEVIPTGRPRADGVELLSSTRMGQLLDSLVHGGSNNLVIIDSGSMLSGSLPAVLASYAGQIVFVIAANETRQRDVDESLTLLDGHIGPLETSNVGLVLNKISPTQSSARYSASTG